MDEQTREATENNDRDIASDNEEGHASDISSHYVDSNEKMMVCNNTDGEDEISYSVFNVKTDMKEPKFQLGMLFETSRIFIEVVKK